MCKQGVTYSLYVGFSSMWGNFSMHSCLSSGIYTNIVHLNKICLNHCLYENSGCYIGGQIYLLSPTGSYVWAFISHAWQGRKWNSAVCDVNKPLLVTELSPCMPILQSLHLVWDCEWNCSCLSQKISVVYLIMRGKTVVAKGLVFYISTYIHVSPYSDPACRETYSMHI